MRPALAIHRLFVLLFLFVALPPALLLALTIPPGETPDEPAHAARAGSLLHGEILGTGCRRWTAPGGRS